MKDSLRAPMTFSMEVEPSVETVPVSSVEVLSSVLKTSPQSVTSSPSPKCSAICSGASLIPFP